MAVAISSVFSPRSFWYTTPLIPTRKVIIPEFRGIGQNGKSIGHLSIHDVILRTAFRFVSLLGEYPEVVAVEWLRFVARVGVTRCFCKVTNLVKGAWSLTIWNTPVQPVLFPFIADELLCILLHRVAIVGLTEILVLRIGKGMAGCDRGQLVFADTTRKNLVLTCRGVEVPLA